MRLLLDTHSFLFWCNDDPALSSKAGKAIASSANECYVSAATVWEVSIKTKAGKMNAQALLDSLDDLLEEHHFHDLPVTVQHAVTAGALPLHHKDPFDRMLVAQAQRENLVVVSRDQILDSYGIRRLW